MSDNIENTGNVILVPIEDEVKKSYLNYAMSVIVSRALPDARDGLKPVHRRILYSMSEMGLRHDKEFKKCARIVGDVLGKFHPHGDQSVYDALVRLAQDFSLRYPVVNGQGNFGSIDNDPPAAMRYTESRMMRIAEEMLKDIKKETVDFIPNYDESMTEPSVLPGAFPFLLANGASGIAVGMATNLASHNLKEICDAIVAYMDNVDITIPELMDHMKGPDFPTGGIIYGLGGIKKAFQTGKGQIVVRSKFTVETNSRGRDVIIVTEIPYAVNKAALVMKIAELVNDKKIEGIADLRDESDRNGLRIVIELKKGAVTKVVLNRLFAHTQLQSNFNINNLALVDSRPKLLNLKDMIKCYVDHREEVETRRIRYDLKKAEERAHILEGLKIALANIDEVIKIIKESKNVAEAKENLMEKFILSEVQAQAILDMRLQKLTSLETQKIIEELEELRRLIAYYKELLSNRDKLFELLKQQTVELKEKFGDDRRTEIIPSEIENLDIEDLIKEEEVAVLFSNKGFVKRVPVSSYKMQTRGGKGSSSANLKNEDFVQDIFIGSTHDYLMLITSEGKAYYLKVHEIPEASKAARGTLIKTLVNISANEEITTVLTIKNFTDDDKFIFMATQSGLVKKVKICDFVNAKKRGIVAISLNDNDRLISAKLTDGNFDVYLITRKGLTLRFNEKSVRFMGRSSKGIKGINLAKDDELVAVLTYENEKKIFFITEFGYGKRMDYDQMNPHSRGTKGQIGYSVSDKTGEVVNAIKVGDSDDLVCITSKGNTVRFSATSVSEMGRTAMGVRVVDITKPDFVVGAACIINEGEEE
ncbi:MAG: DNA topoisomerase (ATP-hydrolyzing) subunit A [Spirochaetales bacterium]|nr:DNA topoisomerase (ATP-hydrolyzing) subunit A [Spirochaetales bacterium]